MIGMGRLRGCLRMSESSPMPSMHAVLFSKRVVSESRGLQATRATRGEHMARRESSLLRSGARAATGHAARSRDVGAINLPSAELATFLFCSVCAVEANGAWLLRASIVRLGNLARRRRRRASEPIRGRNHDEKDRRPPSPPSSSSSSSTRTGLHPLPDPSYIHTFLSSDGPATRRNHPYINPAPTLTHF